MATYSLRKCFPWQGPLGPKAVAVCRMFGMTVDRLQSRPREYQCQLQIDPGDIVFIAGPSGAGKTVLLEELRRLVPADQGITLTDIPLPDDRTVIDCFETDVVTSLRMLCQAGLSEVACLVNRPCHLSEGQKYRFRLARALAAGRPFIFADEFGSELDRITAATVAFNIHKFAKATDTAFILASSHDDLLIDLGPDVLVINDFSHPAQVIYKTRRQP